MPEHCPWTVARAECICLVWVLLPLVWLAVVEAGVVVAALPWGWAFAAAVAWLVAVEVPAWAAEVLWEGASPVS